MNAKELNFKELTIWQKAIDFAEMVITAVEDNTSDRKHYRLLEQAESAATSVSSNIAEGKGRYSKKEFIQFLYIARGSLYETISIMTIFYQKGWINKEVLDNVESEGLALAKMINALIKSIKEKI
ncbi:MAG TPA: four helix bundle protein [Cytophagales bacterium]|jgi:four helix bundle protein|nr:four helix bundle protein [Cytophagales bacterium]